MKVLLISPNRERVPDPVFPLGVGYLAAALKEAGHEVSVLDLCFESGIRQPVLDLIGEFSPHIVGLSLRNIDDVSYPRCVCYLDLYKEVASAIREGTDSPLVLGGAGLTIMPEEFVRELGADFAVVGEGEALFTEFVDRYREGVMPEEKIVRSGGRRSDRWREIIPDRDLFDAGAYYRYGGMLNIQTKRGCPFGCIYCSYPIIEGRKPRMRDPGHVAGELETLVEKTGVRHFFIVDSIFNHPAEHAEKVCDAIIERHLDIRWTCYGNPAYMNRRLAMKMRKAGCTSIEFGTDSLMDETLNVLTKGFTSRHVREASAICRDAGIKFCHFLFVGAPGDTMDRVKENLTRLDGLGAEVSVIMTGIRIFPGTPLAIRAEEELGIREQDLTLKPVYYISPGVIREIDGIVDHITTNHPKWILPGFEINISEKLQALLRKTGIKGSLWEELFRR